MLLPAGRIRARRAVLLFLTLTIELSKQFVSCACIAVTGASGRFAAEAVRNLLTLRMGRVTYQTIAGLAK